MKENILVSACLIGIKCRYDGSSSLSEKVLEDQKNYNFIPVCPEQLGGLSTPRVPSEIINTKVITKMGNDVTDNFNKGVQEALKLLKIFNCKKAILKSKSPMCGCNLIYDGSFSGKLIRGDGMLTKELKNINVEIKSI